jgi:hypothetical protein
VEIDDPPAAALKPSALSRRHWQAASDAPKNPPPAMQKTQFPHATENVLYLFVNSPQHSLAPEKACPQDSTNQVADIENHYRNVIREMVDLGANLIRMVHQEAQQADAARLAAAKPSYDPSTFPAAKSASDLAGAYDLIFRAMRRAILLDGKLAELPKPPSAQQRIAARKRIIRDVEDVIQRKAPDDQAEILRAELVERMDSADLDDEIAHRTIPEIVTDICRDFGIAGLYGGHPWRRRMPHDIAILRARAEKLAAAAPSAELAALLGTATRPPHSVCGNDPPDG